MDRFFDDALTGKAVFPFPLERLGEAGKVDSIFTTRLCDSEPYIRRRSLWAAGAPLFLHLVIGVDLAQMAEWMLRVSAAPELSQSLGAECGPCCA